MSGFNTNLTDRIPARKHMNEVEVFLESDFPAPSSGIITLAADTSYKLMDVISTANVFALPVGEDCEIQGHSLGAELIYTGTVTTGFITSTGVDTGTIRITGLRVELVEDDTIIFDLTATTGGTVVINDMRCIFNGSDQGLGNFESLVLDFSRMFMFNMELGSTFTNCLAFFTLINAIAPTASAISGTLFRFVDGAAVAANSKFTLISTSLQEDDVMFYFDPIQATTVLIDDVTDIAPTKVPMFEAGSSFTISAFADATAGDVTATATGHTFSNGDHILITNSANYYGGYDIFGVAANVFDFTPDAGWSNDDAQPSTAASDASLDETDPRVMVASSPGYKSSATLCGIWAQELTATTTITTQNVYVDVGLDDGCEASAHQELFILEDDNNGEVLYIGGQPKTLCVSCIVSGMMAAGGAINVKFQLLQNGTVLTAPDDVEYLSRWITTDPLQTSCDWIVVAVPEDTFKVQVANAEGTDDIEITQYSFTMA